jgi:Prolyl oligopeptidase family
VNAEASETPQPRRLTLAQPPDEPRPDVTKAVPDMSLGVRAVALLDIELRTFVASMVAASAVRGSVLRRDAPSGHRQAVEFYNRLAARAGRDELFVRPPAGVPVRTRRLGRLPWAPDVSQVDLLSFKSAYRVHYPKVRSTYETHKRNSIARAMHWRHDDGPRPTIIVVHGFTGSPYWFNSNFFSLPWFYGHGCDVLLFTLPYHGRRNDTRGPFSGSGLFSGGISTFTEAMFQSVSDIRVVVDYLEESGVENIGITGLSLGGYLTALMAAVEPRLHMAIPNSAVTDLASLMGSWFPASHLVRLGLRQAQVSDAQYRGLMSLHSPLRYEALIPRERLFIIGGLADRLAPPEQSAQLWEHWGRPKIHWFPGSHILHFGRSSYLREIGRFLRDTGFSTG